MALIGSNNEEKIWNYLYSKIGNAYGVAGLMGNLYHESNLIPNIVEYLCLKRLKENGKNYTQESYTQAVDNGTISRAEFLNPLPNKQYGYSIAQWTSPNRKAKLYDQAKKRGVSIGDLENALDYLWQELNSDYQSVLSVLKTATSVKQASDVVLIKFECPADQSNSMKSTRTSTGQKYYEKYAKKVTSVSNINAIKKLISVAEGEIGYLEKASNSNLYDKTANAGMANFTKYWAELYPQFQGQPWCAIFVTWCMVQAFGKEITKKLLGHFPYTYVPTLASMFTNYSNPQVGDVVCFYHSGVFTHTGLVVAVNGDQFTTIEGNTNNGSTIISNGGSVCKKQYYNSNLIGTKFIRPDYSIVPNTSTKQQTVKPTVQQSPQSQSKTYSEEVKWTGTICTKNAPVRKGAGKNYAKLISYPTLPKGTTVGVCDYVKSPAGNDWYFIKIKDKFGFIYAKHVAKTSLSNVSTTSSRKKLSVNVGINSTLAVRTWAGTEYPQLKTCPELQNGTQLEYINTTKDINGNDWYFVSFKHKGEIIKGFVFAKYTKFI